MTTTGFMAQNRLMGFTVEYPARTYWGEVPDQRTQISIMAASIRAVEYI